MAGAITQLAGTITQIAGAIILVVNGNNRNCKDKFRFEFYLKSINIEGDI